MNGNSMGMHGGRVNMEAEERQQPERQRVWKNKRRASLYVSSKVNIRGYVCIYLALESTRQQDWLHVQENA